MSQIVVLNEKLVRRGHTIFLYMAFKFPKTVEKELLQVVSTAQGAEPRYKPPPSLRLQAKLIQAPRDKDEVKTSGRSLSARGGLRRPSLNNNPLDVWARELELRMQMQDDPNLIDLSVSTQRKCLFSDTWDLNTENRCVYRTHDGEVPDMRYRVYVLLEGMVSDLVIAKDLP